MKKWMVEGKFIPLTDEQLKELSTEELAEYTSDKNKATVEATVKEKTEALEKQIKEMKDSLNDYASKDDMQNRLDTLSERADNLEKSELKTEIEKLQDDVNKQAIELKKRNDNVNDNIDVSVYQKIHSALKEHAETLGKFKSSDRKDNGLVINLKATIVTSAISGDTMAFRVPGVGQIQRRKIYLEELFTSGRVSANNHGVIRYTDQLALTDNSSTIAENAAFPESSLTWIEKTIPIEKVGDTIKISREMMDDVDFVNGEINNFLLRNVALAVDTQLLSGDASTPNLVGLVQSATAFAAGDYAGTVQDANLYDLIAICSAIVQTGTTFMPSGVLMNQSDAVRMKLKKDGENNYVVPTFVIPTENGDITIDGMRVVVNSGVTANTMYVGDFTRGTVYSSDDLQLELGYENDDFTKDLVTVKARRRLALLIKSVDTGAFNYVSDITAALAAIDDTP